MAIVAVGVLVILAGFLMVSAAAKTFRHSAAAAALVELGLPHRAARVIVAIGVAVEEAVATGLMLWPHAPVAQVAGATLFGAFALVAALALRSGRSIECGCFGALHRSTLGWTQVLQFTLVVPSVIVVGRFAPPWSIQTGLGVLFVLQVTVAGLLLAHLSPVWWQIRRDRISLGSVQASVGQAGWPEMPVAEGEAGPA